MNGHDNPQQFMSETDYLLRIAYLERKLREALRKAGSIPCIEIAFERNRQMEVEGWTPSHDDTHTSGCLASAAACYALKASAEDVTENDTWKHIRRKASENLWPFDQEWWKPDTPRRMLIKAGALIVAEIERIDRAALDPPKP